MPSDTLILQLGGSFTDPTLPSLQRDEVIVNGTAFCIDLARSYCWDGSDPEDADPVPDLTLEGRDAVVQIDGGTPTYAGGGFDWEGATDANAAFIKVPTSVYAALWGGAQKILTCLYMKVPTFANWEASGVSKTFYDSSGNSNFTAAPALHAFAMSNFGIQAFRKVTATYNGLGVAHANLSNFYGTVTQLAIWWDGDLVSFRIKNALDSRTASISTSTANATDYSATYGTVGIPESASLRPAGNRQRFRTYRMFIEDLETSDRDPVTVLDADWTRTAGRAVFS
jgi:hypothetical protein